MHCVIKVYGIKIKLPLLVGYDKYGEYTCCSVCKHREYLDKKNINGILNMSRANQVKYTKFGKEPARKP